MAIIFTNTDRRVVQNWKSFTKTARLGELNSYHSIINKSSYKIEEYILDWKKNKSIPFADDLLSAAISNNKIAYQDVKDAANFILNKMAETTFSQQSLAKAILNSHEVNDEQLIDDIDEENLFESILTIDEVHVKISKLKLRIIEYPYNPILYVEIARFYISIGQAEHAIRAIRKALFLGKNNRFVLRSAARLYLHLKDKEQAVFILRNSELTKNDPWLMASEISISSMLSKSSNNIKRGLIIVDSNNYTHASISELASSIATLEYINGSNKKSKKLFHKSLIEPNDNSLAQAEWAASKFLIDDSDLMSIHNLPKNSFYESCAISSFNRKEFNNSIRFASEWIEDMPFAKRPILFASSISTTHLKKYELSERILKIGLQANPNDVQIINNIAYACALNNDIKKADNYLSLIRSNFSVDKTSEICLLATKGLINFRKGEFQLGRELYNKAIEKTRDFRDTPILYWTAFLNYAREELRVNPKARERINTYLQKINDNVIDEDTKALKSDVIKLLN